MAGTENHFESELKPTKLKILAMAGAVERSIEHALEALTERAPTRLEAVSELEMKVNQAHVEIDNDCLGLLARLAPVAIDLRMVLAIIKINTDLERMGDQAVNLARNTEHYLQQKPLEIVREYPRMAKLVRLMVREALDAFVNGDIALAEKVLMSDDAVDVFKGRLIKDLMLLMRADAGSIEPALTLILIARNLERMADHATNIAEDVIFIRTGTDVRHGAGRSK